MQEGPSGFDRYFVVPTSDAECHVDIGFDIDRSDVTRFLVALVMVGRDTDRRHRQIARVDHNPSSLEGHDVRTEGIHVDVALESGDERTVYPDDAHVNTRKLGTVINGAKRYFRTHVDYFRAVYAGRLEPDDPPRWP